MIKMQQASVSGEHTEWICSVHSCRLLPRRGLLAGGSLFPAWCESVSESH